MGQIKKYAFTIRATDYVSYKEARIPIVPINTKQLSNFLEMYGAEFCYQLEHTVTEAGNSNPHYQGRVKLLTRKRKDTVVNRFIDYFHSNLLDKTISKKAIASLATFSPEYNTQASEFYCMKTDHTVIPETQVIFPIPEPPYDGSDLIFGDSLDEKYKWQSEIRFICDCVIACTVPEDTTFLSNGWQRSIPVIQDQDGGKGKSTFTKTMLFENPNDTVFIPVVDTPGQIMGALAKHKSSLKRVFIDIPRDLQYQDVRKVFMLAELIKLGMFTTSYYATLSTRLQAPPAVVIFTNREFYRNEIDSWAPLNRFEFYNINDGCLHHRFDFEYRKNKSKESPEKEIVEPELFDGIK